MAIHKRVFRTVASLFGSDGDGQHAGDASRISHDRVPPRPTQKHLQTSPLNRREFDKTHEIPVADESAKFDEALSRLIGKRERLVAGSLEIIGLDDVRDALGAQWSLFKDTTIQLAQDELRRSLGPSSVFRRHGDASFLIHFDGISKDAAEEEARQIAHQIRRMLVKTLPEIADAISARSFVAVIDSAELAQSGGVADALLARLTSMRSDVVADLQRRRKSLYQNTFVSFSPIWNAHRELALLHHCHTSTFRHSQMSALWQELVNPEETAGIIAEIDYVVLTKSLEAIHRLRRYNRAAPLLIPVDMRTVSSTATCREYIRLLGAAPTAYRKYIVLEVCKIDADATSIEIYEIVKTLESHIKGLVAHLPLDDKRVTEIAASGVCALSTDITGVDVLDPCSIAPMRRFATADGISGINTIARGANSIGLAVAAMNAGFALIEGTAICPPTQEPRSDFRLHAKALLPTQIGPSQSNFRTFYERNKKQ